MHSSRIIFVATAAAGLLGGCAAKSESPTGVTAVPRCVLHTLYAIESVLAKMGYGVIPGVAINRAEQVYAGAEAREPVKAVADAVRKCGSGRELVENGHAADVELAVEIGVSDAVPVLLEGVLR